MPGPLNLTDAHASFGPCSGTYTSDGNYTVAVRISPAGGTGPKLESATDVAIIIDASFSMFAGFYRNAKVLNFVEAVTNFLLPYDDDGVDVFLHSLRDGQHVHLGAFTNSEDVLPLLGSYMEAPTAMKAMGQKTFCAAVIRDAAERLLVQKGSRRVFIEVVTDGAFDDKEALEQTIVELGNRYNTPEDSKRFRLHFSGIGAGGAAGMEFLKYLDDELGKKHPGFIDCVDYDSAASVDANIASIIKELETGVSLQADNVMITVTGEDGTEPTFIRTGDDTDWEPGNVKSLEALPVSIEVYAVFAGAPKPFIVTLQYVDSVSGEYCEASVRCSA